MVVTERLKDGDEVTDKEYQDKKLNIINKQVERMDSKMKVLEEKIFKLADEIGYRVDEISE